MQQNNLTLMVIFPVLGCFPVYRLTVSQARKTNKKSLLFLYIKMLEWIYPETFVNKWTDGCKLTWSLLDTYIWHILRNNSIGKQMSKNKKRSQMHMLYVQNIRVYKVLCTKYLCVQKYFTWYFKNLFFYAWIPLRISRSKLLKKYLCGT